MEKQKFEIGIDKVKKNPVPLLVVGLGGTGRDAVLAVKRTFTERFVLPKNEKGQDLPAPEKTAYLVFDIESRIPDGLDAGEYVDISFPGLDRILKNQDAMLKPFEKSWVDPRLELSSPASSYVPNRQASRLALSRNFNKVMHALKGALFSIVSDVLWIENHNVNQVEIAVITGIGGGTGSGIFLDISQMLRYAAKQTVTVVPARLTGYIIMPDVSLLRVGRFSGMEMPIKQNAYAALKELDFWMRVREHRIPYSMQYGEGTAIAWDEPPFDQCILMSASNVDGIPYRDPYSAVMDTIAGQLLHNMADTIPQYAYRLYEDNMAMIGMHVPVCYPLFHGYKAIGAFTKRIPRKSILYYEGRLLLKTFIPMRDDSGKLQPDRRMFTDGQGKPRAENITGKGPQLMQDFRINVCRLPGFCNMDLNDKLKVAAVQNMNPPPHCKWHTWVDTVSGPAAVEAADKYLEQAWMQFEEWAASVMTDPTQGPFALLAYLEAPEGLIGNLEEILASWTIQYHKTRNQLIPQGEEMCNNAWGPFRSPPLLGRRGALAQYDHAIKSLYTYVDNCQFLEKHLPALEKLILRVKEYLWDGLKPLCASIEFLNHELNTPVISDPLLEQDIYPLTTVQAGIDAAFQEENASGKLSNEFLAKIAEISLRTTPNLDTKTSGVNFICCQAGLEEMCRVLQKELDACFCSINHQSLDDIMIANAGASTTRQQKWMDDLAGNAIDNALPMFMQDPLFAQDMRALYGCMSIPQSAPNHLNYIRQAFQFHDPAVLTHASTLDDLFVLMSWEKLSQYRYGLFEQLRKACEYGHQEYKYGLHLVQSVPEGQDSDYLNDWSKLPSPKPYFLFPGDGIRSEQEEYKKVHDLVLRGIQCGMVAVNEDVPYAEASVSMLFTSNGDILPSSTLMKQAEDIRDAMNPVAGDVYEDSEIHARLKQLLDDGSLKIVTEHLRKTEVHPGNLAGLLGLSPQSVDPFDPLVQFNNEALRVAKENYHKLCVRMTEAMIYTRPDLVRALEIQLPLWEASRDGIGRDGQAGCEGRES